MFNNVSPKAIALGGISASVLAMIGIAVEATKGELFEIRKSLAAVEEARASNKAAEAATLDAMNKLKAALETAGVMDRVGRLQANATIAAANQTAAATIKAAETTMHPENETYDSLTGPLIGEPSKKIAKLNEEIRRLNQKAKSSWLDNQRDDYLAQAARLEEEKQAIEQSASQNISDMMNLVIGGMGQSLGGLYPNMESRKPGDVHQEK